MENESSNFGESLAKSVASSAGQRAWNLFVRRAREKVSIDVRIEDPAFWAEIAKLTPRISAHPVLVVSRESAISGHARVQPRRAALERVGRW